MPSIKRHHVLTIFVVTVATLHCVTSAVTSTSTSNATTSTVTSSTATDVKVSSVPSVLGNGGETTTQNSDVVLKKIAAELVAQLNKNENATGNASASVVDKNVVKSQNVEPPEVYADIMVADQPQGDITKTLQRRSQIADGGKFSTLISQSFSEITLAYNAKGKMFSLSLV